MDRSRIIVHLHIAVVIMLRKTLIPTWYRRCAKIILDKTAFRIPSLWNPWHFELYVVGQIQSQGHYLGVRFIFELQNLRGHPDRFSWLVKNRAYFGSAQNTQLLEVFFARTELLALGVVHSPVLVGRKRDRDKTRVVLCSSVRNFCSRPIRARLSRTVSSSAHWKLVSYGLRRQWCLFSWGLLQVL